MKCYAAPLEGITTFVFRNLHHEMFPEGVDKYFTPFLAVYPDMKFKKRDLRDILPENNAMHFGGRGTEGPSREGDVSGPKVVPQILANRTRQFVWAVKEIASRGYREINFNLGCPIGTVVHKKRGAGFLGDPDALDRFFEEAFEALSGEDVRLSVKTRLGLDDESELDALMRIYNRYPFEELIIHARTRKDMYRGTPRLQAFAGALAMSVHPVCYNGNLFTAEDIGQIRERFPECRAVMAGRGLIADPALFRAALCGENGQGALRPEELLGFTEEAMRRYADIIPEERNLLFKLKALWVYMGGCFPEEERLARNVLKSASLAEFRVAVRKLTETAKGRPLFCGSRFI